MHRVVFRAGEEISEAERFHGLDKVFQSSSVRYLIPLGIDLAVAANVREAGARVRIGPPVRRDAHIVALVSAWRLQCLLGYREIPDRERSVGVAFEPVQGAG